MTQTDHSVVEFAGERVTHSRVRDIELPGGAGILALITLDNGFDHTKPNTLGPGGLNELGSALEGLAARADNGEIAAVAITGKPFILAAGADLTGVVTITERQQAYEIGHLGHLVLGRLSTLGVPSFAYVNGLALGGGLEIALNCTYRTISSGVPALALPEVFLGLVPGWGGAYLLPNLIGPQRALKVIIENPLSQNRMLKGPQAYELGIADVMLEPADFLEESISWTAKVLTGQATVDRPVVDKEQSSWDGAVDAAKALVDSKLKGSTPAPYRALDLVRAARTAERDAAFAAEDEALADLLMGDELRAGLYSFDLVQKRAKRPVGVPDKSLARPVTKVGVVGAGLMASQLALLFARRLQVPVVMTDVDQSRVDKGVAYVHSEVDKLLGKGRVSPDGANRIKALVAGSLTKDAFADADFVIEAVFEDLAVKQQVFAEVEAVVSSECILATNTSSLSVSAMAADLKHPERVVGFHFFNPVAILPLLEIVRGERTDDVTLATAFATGKQLKKSAVLVADAPAFVFNRVFMRFLGEAITAIDEGADFVEADHALDSMGLPMSPLILLQLVGPAVTLHVQEVLHDAFPDRFRVSENLRKLTEAGKTSFYLWDSGKPEIDPEVAALYGPREGGPTGEQIRQRALEAIAEEIRILLEDKVVAEAQDVDLCMLLGGGWPFHLGGITPYLDRTGISEKVNGRKFLASGIASVPS